MSTMIPTISTVAMTAPAASTARAANIANNNCANNNCVNSDGDGGGNSRSGADSRTVPFYRVRQSWDKPKTQIAAFTKLENAQNCVNCNPGFAAFDEAGKQVYPKVCPKEVKQS